MGHKPYYFSYNKRYNTPKWRSPDPRVRSLNTANVRNMVIQQNQRRKNFYTKPTARSQANRLKSSRNTRNWNRVP